MCIVIHTHIFLCVCAQSLQSSLDSLRCHGLKSARLLCPWDFPGKNAGVACHALLQGIFLTQGLNSCLLHRQKDSLLLSHQGTPPAISIYIYLSIYISARNLGVRVSFQICAFFFCFWIIFPGVELLGHMVVLFLVFLRNFHTVFHSGCSNLHSH